MIEFEKIPAKSISYGGRRNLKDVEFIVIHYTGNKNDTARGNGLYFRCGNTREAGAHWFVDRDGIIVRSIPMTKTAWSVGGFFTGEHDAAMYYKRCINANSVSIELCSLTEWPSIPQQDAVRNLVEFIQKKCPNAKKIIRHWDVNGKQCPASMCGKGNKVWLTFKQAIKTNA